MKSFSLLFLLLLTVSFACQKNASNEVISQNLDNLKSAFKIEILDNEALEVINSNETIEIMASGFTWTEGPLWIREGNYLLFSDIPNNKVYKLETTGDTSTYLQPSGKADASSWENEPGSNGLLLNNQGELILMQHGDRRVARMNASLSSPKENYISLVDNYNGKRLNSPNDGFYDQDGNLYFTDPPYGLPGLMEDPNKELDFQGVYCLLASGELKLLDTLSRPNGLTLSPDGSIMYVAVSDPNAALWYRYDITSPGTVTNKKVLHDVTYLVGKEGQQGLPDGLKANDKGYLFATGPGGVWIFNPSGKVIARIHTGQKTSNCALAHGDKQLFMTADDYILSVQLK